jgi:hypothetical protein
MASPARKLFLQAEGFKRIALRTDKTDQSFAAMIYIAAALINSRSILTGSSSGVDKNGTILYS